VLSRGLLPEWHELDIYIVVLGGVMSSVLSIGPKARGVSSRQWIFKDGKNSQHAFLRRKVKPSAPLAQDFTAC
jgi:hypothetical protein